MDNPVPEIPAHRIGAIEAWLAGHRNAHHVEAPMLAIICALYEQQRPLPTRHSLGEALGCDIFSVDGAIYKAMAEGEISEEYHCPWDSRPTSIRRHRYLLPSQKLYDAYGGAAPRPAPGSPPLLSIVPPSS